MALLREMLDTSLAWAQNEAGDLVQKSNDDAPLGYDWDRASDQILHGRCYHSRSHVHHPWSHWYEHGDWDWTAAPYRYQGRYGYTGGMGGPPAITLEELTAWLWTPETTAAFSLLLVVLSLFLCCWISHKVGEFLCTTTAGISALGLLIVVFFVFLSQWTVV